MAALVQDSILGQLIRFVSRGRCFQYPEEKDPSLWQQYVNRDKSGRMAYTGRIDAEEVPETVSDDRADSGSMTRVPSSTWSDNGRRVQGMTGVTIDPEKGRDTAVVDWWGDNDPEVCLYALSSAVC